jgi:protocatechuate 3,4-dioxygenase beta subunit
LIPGIYSVAFATVADHKWTVSNTGNEDGIDSDPINGVVSDIVLLSNTKNESIDAGYLKPISIGDFVWEDLNVNGIQDIGEPGIQNVALALVGTDVTNTEAILFVQTDANGAYTFNNVYPGQYQIALSIPFTYSPTRFLSGTAADDSNLDPNATSIPLVVNSTVNDNTIDFGLVRDGSIGDLVWEDTNCDGIKDPSENGLPSVVVRLTGQDLFGMAVTLSTVTTIDGEYTFFYLKPGTYSVEVDLPTGYFLGQGAANSVTLLSGQMVETVDIPLFRKGSIGDFVWNDSNQDGIQQTDELGIGGVEVTLTSTNLATPVSLDVLTDNAGRYIFDQLKPGTYQVSFDAPSFFTPTLSSQGGILEADSDIDNTGLVSNIVILSGQDRTDIDAGYFSVANGVINGLAWEDTNVDGQQQATEPILTGIPIDLYSVDASGTTALVASLTTDPSGTYSFMGLLAGDYKVKVGTTSGLLLTLANVGANVSDSDVDVALRETATISIATNATSQNNNVGLFKNASIGDFVWFDTNEDGIQQADEAGIAGVKVSISAQDASFPFTAEVTTDANGKYEFVNLRPGIYNISVETPSNFSKSPSEIGADDADSDINDLGIVSNIAITSGQNRLDIDAGFFSVNKGAINGTVWRDLDADGQNASPETGIVNIPVQLLKQDNAGVFSLVNTTTTDAAGAYVFNGLVEGSYKVFLNDITSYNLSIANIGDDATDSDFDVVGKESAIVLLGTNMTVTDIDAGLYQNGSIGDFVWFDANEDGLQQADESGLAGVKVSISALDASNTTNTMTTTGTDGKYTFTGLRPGRYKVTFEKPLNFTQSPQDQGMNDDLDSDPDADGLVSEILITSGTEVTNVDAGYFSLAKGLISGIVWDDYDADGQYSSELGVSGVAVELYKVDNAGVSTFVSATTTDVNGNYAFNGLLEDTYKVVLGATAGFMLTQANVGADDTDSDIDVLTRETSLIVLAANQQVKNIYIGLFKNGTIGDFAWNDLNGDGTQTLGEPGIPGVQVTIVGVGANASYLNEDLTDADGKYLFENLPPGTYRLSFVTPAGFTATTIQSGASADGDSDINGAGQTSDITIFSGAQRLDIDAGYTADQNQGTIIAGNAWEDKNGDGQRAASELPIPGIIVNLLSIDGSGNALLMMTTSTDGDGNYKFEGLQPGNYKVLLSGLEPYFLSTPNVGNDFSDSDFEIATSETAVLALSGGSLTNVDAGLYQKSNIGDFVWSDTNRDGIQQSGELGIGGIVVNIESQNPSPPFTMQTTTSGDGMYAFTDLAPGTYKVTFTKPDNANPTTQNVAQDRTVDSDIDANGEVIVMVMSGVFDNTVDAGYISLLQGTISGNLWEDKDGDGQREAGELAVAGKEVSAYAIDATGAPTFIGTTTTNTAGFYEFLNLTAGNYQLVLGDVSPSFVTKYNVGNEATNSDFDRITRSTTILNLLPNTSFSNIDGGIYNVGSVGDFVWNDANQNGTQDAGEVGLAGVTLTLVNESGTVVSTQVSDANGAYQFSNLEPGTYGIVAMIPDPFVKTLFNVGASATNSDFAEAAGIVGTLPFLVMSGMQIVDIDLGCMLVTTSISGLTWADANNDGIRQDSEEKLSGVTVYLINATTGDTISQQLSSATGTYRFDDLAAGNYQIGFDTVSNRYITLFNVGSVDRNSDAMSFDQRLSLPISVAIGTNIKNVDAGYVNGSTIGDFVWIDADSDGIQGTSEVGQNGVKVYLLNNLGIVIDSTISGLNMTTGQNGFYVFDNLPYGDYILDFDLPRNFAYTIIVPANASTNSDVTNIVNGQTDLITLTPGQSRTDIDAGYIVMAATKSNLSGVAWRDVNGDRLRNPGEPLLANVAITLKNAQNVTIGTTTTNSNGAYTFVDLDFGDYYLVAPAAAGSLYVPYGGMPLPFDSEFNDQFGVGSTRLISMFPGVDVTDADLGYAFTINVGDFVWEDVNVNGLIDANEAGIAGVKVSALNLSNTVVAMTTTGTDGRYTFTNIPTGKYKFRFMPSTQYTPTFQDFSMPEHNSDIDENNLTDLFDFQSTGTYSDVDAGYLKFACIGDRVWLDLNGNGFYQAGEPGVANIKVFLYTASGELRDSTITMSGGMDTLGMYKFSDVIPGNYYLSFALADTFVVSPAGVGTEDLDNDITSAFGGDTTDEFAVGSGANVTDIDAGIYVPACIGDRVWLDNDGDGIQDAGEPGQPDVEVYLYAQNGLFIGSTITDENGLYSFCGLRQRLYFLQFAPKDGFLFTLRNQGPIGSLDSDVDETGTTALISIAHGVKFLEIDAGLVKSNLRIVSGTIWDDLDQDGLRDVVEPFMPNVEVSLLDTFSNVLRKVKTNVAGRYSFVVVDKKMHYVQVQSPTNHLVTIKGKFDPSLPNSDVDESGKSDGLNLIIPVHPRVDAGFFKKTSATLMGRVWVDKNANLLRDQTDTIMQYVLVLFFDKENIFVKSTRTDANGRYIFTGITPGSYYVKVQSIPSMEYIMFTGTNQDRDSEITHQFGTGTSRPITLANLVTVDNFDLGFSRLGLLQDEKPELSNAKVNVSIYPNPVFWALKVDVKDKSSIASYSIYNPSGTLVQKGEVTDEKIDVAELSGGMYYIRVISDKFNETIPFIKIENR